MAYDDGIREAVYTSPGEKQFTLQFDAVERSGGKKAAVHELVQQNIADVQDLGNTAEKFPFACYFTGVEAASQADAFWSALGESGPGNLQHPRYGDLHVLPLSWSSTEDFVGKLGRVDFRIDFIKVPEEVGFPQTSIEISESVGITVDDALEIQADEFSDTFSPENAADLVACRENALSSVESFSDEVSAVVSGSTDLATQFDSLVRDIENGIDTLLEAPTEFVEKFTQILRLPAQAIGKITSKITGYYNRIVSAVESVPKSYSQAVLYVTEMLGLLSGAVEATTIGDISSRQEAVNISDLIDEIFTLCTRGIEAAEGAVDIRPSVEAIAQLSDAVASARESLLTRAFSLRSERSKILATSRTPLDLIYELYGDLDNLDDFLETNSLEGDEILLIPAGREVLYYE